MFSILYIFSKSGYNNEIRTYNKYILIRPLTCANAQCAVSGSEHRFTKNLNFRVVFSCNDNTIASALKSYNCKYHQIGGKGPRKMGYTVYKSILVSRSNKKSNLDA